MMPSISRPIPMKFQSGVDLDHVDAWVAAAPDEFTPWFLLEWRAMREVHADSVTSKMFAPGQTSKTDKPEH